MKTSDPDPKKRWQAIIDFYIEFAACPNWEFLLPMVDFVEWAAHQPMAEALYPGTSHEHLTVSMHVGYNPHSPFLAVQLQQDGHFECTLYTSVGKCLRSRTGRTEEAKVQFTEMVARLVEIASTSQL